MKIKYRDSPDPRSREFNKFIVEEFPGLLKEENPDLIFLAGGDGAMLHAVQEMNKYNATFFGYAAGTLNFLMNELSFENVSQIIQNLQQDKTKLHTINSTLIKVELDRKGKRELLGQAVNEVVIGSTIMGYHHFCITSNDGSFNDFEINGSGISVSTDLGSTGYNFNLGGSVIPLGSGLWAVLGIVCNRYLEDILDVDEIEISCNSKTNVKVFLDAIPHDCNLDGADKIVLSKGKKIQLGFLDEAEFLKKRIDISSRFRKS